MSKIVVALGGNALGNSALEQQHKAHHTAEAIVDVIEAGHEVIITHGNGPQVGMINLAFEEFGLHHPTQSMPFPECGAMSQGYIGYHLQNALQEAFRKRKLHHHVTTIITQVEVNPQDEAFIHPTKPIGAFVSIDEAQRLEQQKGYVMKEDAGRGYRRVVASPKPMAILELEAIKTLVAAHHTVITVGGGGIPVIKNEDSYEGVAAVIDKDAASSLLADLLDADILCILTAVDAVSLFYNTPQAVKLSHLTIADGLKHIEDNHFAKGSMLPKVVSAIEFVQKKPTRTAIIAALDQFKSSLDHQSGTIITH